jgi:hypothetical protein
MCPQTQDARLDGARVYCDVDDDVAFAAALASAGAIADADRILLRYFTVLAGYVSFQAQVRLTGLAVLAQLSAVHAQLTAAEPTAIPQLLVDLCAFVDLQARCVGRAVCPRDLLHSAQY